MIPLTSIDYVSCTVIAFGLVSIIGGVAYANRGIAIQDWRYRNTGNDAIFGGAFFLVVGVVGFLLLNWNDLFPGVYHAPVITVRADKAQAPEAVLDWSKFKKMSKYVCISTKEWDEATEAERQDWSKSLIKDGHVLKLTLGGTWICYED